MGHERSSECLLNWAVGAGSGTAANLKGCPMLMNTIRDRCTNAYDNPYLQRQIYWPNSLFNRLSKVYTVTCYRLRIDSLLTHEIPQRVISCFNILLKNSINFCPGVYNMGLLIPVMRTLVSRCKTDAPRDLPITDRLCLIICSCYCMKSHSFSHFFSFPKFELRYQNCLVCLLWL